MPTMGSSGKIEFHFSPKSERAPRPRDPEDPFCLAVMGDFSGRSSRGLIEPIGTHRVYRVDCDNWEKVLSLLGAQLRLPAPQKPGETIDLHFANLADFHPDRIVTLVAPIHRLVQWRGRLLNPATAPEAALELPSWLATQTVLPGNQSPEKSSNESNEATIARLLGSAPPPSGPTPPAAGGINIQNLIRNLVAPSTVPSTSPQQTALLSALDLELVRQLREVLHHPALQSLEATWRGTDLLVRNFGGEENIKLFLVDVSRQELAADLLAPEELAQSGFWRLFREPADRAPFALMVGLYTFGDTAGDAALLERLARIAAFYRAPFIAAGSALLIGTDSLEQNPYPETWTLDMSAEDREAWQALRMLPESAYLGLALPRFLVRQPYGQGSDPIEGFPFEELPAGPPHEAYLWGNPAILCGYVMAEAFQAAGWEMTTGGYGEIEGLPVHTLNLDGESQVKPCAEVWLSERAGEAVLEKGLIPVGSIKGRDAVRVGPLQSLRCPPDPLVAGS